jgi:hypothetical protein
MFKTRSLPVALTDTELLLRGQTMADLQREIATAEAKKTADAKAAKEEIDTLKGTLSFVSEQVRTKCEYRDVDIIEEKHYDDDTQKHVMRTIRADTGEMVSVRPLTDSERQTELGIVESIADAREKKAAVAGSEKAKPAKKGKKKAPNAEEEPAE